MIKEKLRTNDEALQLVKLLCTKLSLVRNFNNANIIYRTAILKAAELGVREVVETLLDIFPHAILRHNDSSQSIFHIAVKNRSQEVYNLIYQMSDNRHQFSSATDKDHNNLLHASAKLAPSHKLDEIPTAALQMQRELQWFKVSTHFILLHHGCLLYYQIRNH